MIPPETEAAVESALGAPLAGLRPIGGGCINEAFGGELADGRRVFVKTNPSADDSMFAAEARGLAWLGEAGAIRVPEVLAVEARFLVLELIEPGPRAAVFDQRLGRGLAALHQFGAGRFGLDHDNFIGSLPQDNTPADDWPTFYAERRLLPQVRRAAREGIVDGALVRDVESLCGRLPELVGEQEPPARLHGDLWGGNLHVDESGGPCLIDPAVYGGHREIDLAMMQLFGGFSPAVFAAYDEAFPLLPEWRDRVLLYQAYPLLVHVNLFGGGYAGQARRAIRRYL